MSEQLTGRALDRAIAASLGYTVRPNNASRFGSGYSLIAPNGEMVCIPLNSIASYCIFDTEDEAWSPTPEWSTDANATLAVCAERGWELRFEFDDSEEEITYVAWIAADVMRPIGSGYMSNEYDGRSTASCQEAAARALLAALTATADSENGGVA